ncbi:hypothetical protein BBF96_12805 [Anoxybacter fermentans]|uniref:EamA domain-containing protein n=1 Tax=Anoxybacter fermentans TaxID=1323375 RepID=A0A3Q9HTR4_9FIRM|nr:DMT family transporter [Anoxybacter fermentans]AZR74200.1 hypothetical protein BBF96_12805 [Anoxybacter fermentans]
MTNQMKAIVYLAFAVLAFSSMELVGKMVATQMIPLQVTFLRFAIGFFILVPFIILDIKRRKITLAITDLGWMVILGICNITFAMVLLQKAVTAIPASLAAIIISSNPIFTVIFASIILKEKITYRKITGLILGVLGLSLVTDIFSFSVSEVNGIGVLAAVGASFFFGLYTVLSKKVVKRLGTMITNGGAFFSGSLTLLFILLIKGEPILTGLNRTTIGPILFLGIVVSGLAYLAFLEGLNLIDASKGGIVFFFKPIIASIMAFIILNETIKVNMVVGTIFIILGSVIMVLEKAKPSQIQHKKVC